MKSVKVTLIGVKVTFLMALISLSIINAAQAHIYPDTPERRRTPTLEERRRMIRYGDEKMGCSASALTPDTIITAEHCSKLTVGHFELDPKRTFKVLKVLESSTRYSNDVAIIKIKWLSGAPKELLYTRELLTHESQVTIGEDGVGNRLVSLGYPLDQNKLATHSWGYLRGTHFYPRSVNFNNTDSLYLKVNVPLTNGNSGGAVYLDDGRLVGIVSSGGSGFASEETMKSPQYHSQNPKFWNEVASIYYLYPQMKTLQNLYPNGINPQVNEQGEWIGSLQKKKAQFRYKRNRR